MKNFKMFVIKMCKDRAKYIKKILRNNREKMDIESIETYENIIAEYKSIISKIDSDIELKNDEEKIVKAIFNEMVDIYIQ